MNVIGLLDRIRRAFAISDTQVLKTIQTQGDAITGWTGQLYDSDIVRACIAPYAKAVSKLQPVHVRRTDSAILVNPEPYIRFLLQEPNPYMTTSVMLEKVAIQLALNANAFILIARDPAGYPVGLYPIKTTAAEAVYTPELRIRFSLPSGKVLETPYTDIIHIKTDVTGDGIFGESPAKALLPLMDVVHTTDRGIIKAIKNSGVVQWLLKFSNSMRPEDVKLRTQEFVDNYLNVSSDSFGAAGIDSKVDAIRIEPKDYVPASGVTSLIYRRIFQFFGTNEKIVNGSYTEEEWNAYFESRIEPVIVQLGQEFSRKLFSRRERAFGNEIVFEASSLMSATLKTKLQLVSMVDRGALTPNEWRAVFNLSPVEGGDVPLRRLDTTTVTGTDPPDPGET